MDLQQFKYPPNTIDSGALHTFYKMTVLHASHMQIIIHIALQRLLPSVCITQNSHIIFSTAPDLHLGG